MGILPIKIFNEVTFYNSLSYLSKKVNFCEQNWRAMQEVMAICHQCLMAYKSFC